MPPGQVEPLIVAENLSYRYRRARGWALTQVDLAVERGRVLGLVGPNGSGKTTLYRLILGFARPGTGQLLIDGAKPSEYRKQRGIGYLPERLQLPGRLRLAEFAGLMAALAGLKGKAARDSIGRITELLAIDACGEAMIDTLSHGYRQRVGLLAALIGDPELILLDEPATGLDPISLGLLRGLVRALRRAGTTVIISSHNLSELERVCDSLVILQRGRVLGRRTREQLARHKAIWVVRVADNAGVTGQPLPRGSTGVQLAADEVAFAGERAARLYARELRRLGLRVESVDARPFDLEFIFHSLLQRHAADKRSS